MSTHLSKSRQTDEIEEDLHKANWNFFMTKIRYNKLSIVVLFLIKIKNYFINLLINES